MVWFQVDDNLAFHPKAVAAGNAAMGLWVRAGAWSAANLTDGFIPYRVAYQLGSRANCERLVKEKLFDSTPDGYQFHDWNDRNLTKNEVEEKRRYDRKRKADQRKQRLVPVVSERNPSGVPAASPIHTNLVGVGMDRNSHQPTATGAAPSGGGASLQEIANCDLCDDDGRLKNGMVCDHIDRRFTNAHGSKQVREQMGWKT